MSDLARLNSCGLPLLDSEPLQQWERDADARSKAVEEETARRRRHEAAARTNNWEDWNDWVDGRIEAYLVNYSSNLLGAIAQERGARQEETKAAIAEPEGALETRLAALEQRLESGVGDRWNGRIAGYSATHSADLFNAIAEEREARREQIEAGLFEFKRLIETGFDAQERRLQDTIDRLNERLNGQTAVAQARLRTEVVEAVSKAITDQLRAQFGRDLEQARETQRETQRALEAKIARLEEQLDQFKARLQETVDRLDNRTTLLPVVDWRPESVTYANALVAHEGQVWQAARNTGQMPGGSDWVLVARRTRRLRRAVTGHPWSLRHRQDVPAIRRL
jgi:hypothetical protein